MSGLAYTQKHSNFGNWDLLRFSDRKYRLLTISLCHIHIQTLNASYWDVINVMNGHLVYKLVWVIYLQRSDRHQNQRVLQCVFPLKTQERWRQISGWVKEDKQQVLHSVFFPPVSPSLCRKQLHVPGSEEMALCWLKTSNLHVCLPSSPVHILLTTVTLFHRVSTSVF